MSEDVQFLETLRKLSSEQDNHVAALVLELHEANYPESPDSWLTAIKTAAQKTSELAAKAARAVPPLNLRPEHFYEDYPDFYHQNGYSRLMNQAGIVGQVWPGRVMGIHNRPGPLASMMVLGLLGAGAGRIGAAAVNRIGGGENPTLTRNMTVLGGLAGMVPGAISSAVNMYAGKDPLFGDAMAVPMRKFSYTSRTQYIPVEGVHDLVWKDPWVASQLPPTIAAAASAITEGASRIGNKQQSVPFITPSDIGRMAVGLGSGYASGWLAGKALGALFGVSESSQHILKQTGAAAGLLRAIIPPVFGG